MVSFFTRRNRSFVELSEEELFDSVGKYVRYIETAKTRDTCKCHTEVHPDDAKLPAGEPRRLRVIHISLECPVHSREGYLLGYFKFMERR